MVSSKKVALITGANKGIGYEIARQLGAQGITVYIGSRNELRGITSVNRLVTEGIDAKPVIIDLNDSGSIDDAVHLIKTEHGHLDILVNNAGIIDPDDNSPGLASINTIKRTFETNFFGTFMVTQAMLPLLRKAESARIVNISSGLGSLTLNQDPEWEFAETKLIGYNSSKAALNMLTVQLACELRNTGIKVNSANPNFTDTDLVPGAIGGRPVSDGARTAVGLALLSEDGPSGGFFDDGLILPW